MGWLRLFRAQTAFATFYTIATPYLLAGGSPHNLLVILPLSIALHYFSFGHNSLMDYWHDVKDLHKQHHPLVKGDISIRVAHQVIHTMGALIAFILIALTLHLSPSPSTALAFLLIYAVLGHAYNDGLDKNTIHSWVPISLCFTALAGYGWFLATERIDTILYLILAVTFTSTFYQIAFEGNLKDICVENTLLNKLAKEVECMYSNNMTRIRYVGVDFWWLRAIVDTLIILAIIYLRGMYDFSIILLILTTGVQASTIVRLSQHVRSRDGIDRNYMLELFGRIEALQFFRILTTIVVDISTFILYITLVVAGICYFVVMNKVLWGSKWGPRV